MVEKRVRLPISEFFEVNPQNERFYRPFLTDLCPNARIAPREHSELTGLELKNRWSALPRSIRFRLLRALAQTIARYYRKGYALQEVNLLEARYCIGPDAPSVQFWPPPSRTARRRMTHAKFESLLAGWHDQTASFTHSREQYFVLRELLRDQGVDDETIVYAGERISSLSRRRAMMFARNSAEHHLRKGTGHNHSAGYWEPHPKTSPDELLRTVFAIEQHPDTPFLKRGNVNQVFRGTIMGEDCIIKRHNIVDPIDQFKYRFRKSRARRAWATAKAMHMLGIPTPDPLGFVETRHPDGMLTSYYVSRTIPEARTARQYIKPSMHHESEPTRRQVAHELLDMLIQLYDHGIYHADTKTGNMLVTNENDPEQRRFYWIDLDAVRFGVTPTRALVIRNLIQLNGSIGTRIKREDRLYFLSQVARRFTWARDPVLPDQIEAETRERLLREVRRECGH